MGETSVRRVLVAFMALADQERAYDGGWCRIFSLFYLMGYIILIDIVSRRRRRDYSVFIYSIINIYYCKVFEEI